MARNIVICCDGTANEFAIDRTNVIKLYSVLVQDPAVQLTYYHPGIGTMEPAGALTPLARRVTKLLGKAVGYGLLTDVQDAFRFLMRHFEPGDRLFLFGFSRGAYTVRAVAALLRMYGLIRLDNDALVPYAVRMMVAIDRCQGDHDVSKYFQLARDFRDTMNRVDCRPWFVGVWDTVSSIGWIENPLKLPYVTNNPDIHIGRHAVSIDEHRSFFRSHLWGQPVEVPDPLVQDLKQVWFPGVHCDIGGGYPEEESGLAKLALEWMLEEAKRAGLATIQENEDIVLGRTGQCAPPDANGVAHESLRGAWHIAEFIPKVHYDARTKRTARRMNLYRRRSIPAGSLVHESAFVRANDYKDRLPSDAEMVRTRRGSD
jgi:uncharacterized protein (DUF2235 family)